MEHINKGEKYREVARMFGVSTNSIWHWQALEKEQGHLKKTAAESKTQESRSLPCQRIP